MRTRSKVIVFSMASIGVTLFALATVTIVDRVSERILSRQGFFSLMTPGLTEVYKTSEFSVTATISAQGLRNPLVVVPKPKDTRRLLVLGDSFTFGWGVDEEDAWPKHLERLLGAQTGQSVEIVNAAAPGMTINTETSACRMYKARFDPDLILLGVYVTDDLYQITAEDALGGRMGLVNRFWPTLTKIRGRVLMHSWHEKGSGETAYSEREWRRRAGANVAIDRNFLQKLDPEIRDIYLTGKLNPSIISFAVNAPNYLVALLDQKAKEQAMDVYRRYVVDFIASCGNNIPVAVVIIPGNELVSEAYQVYRGAEGYEVDPQLLTLDLDTSLSDIFRESAGFISLLPLFRSDGCPGCYYNWDMHLTPFGHSRVARQVFPVVEKIVRDNIDKSR